MGTRMEKQEARMIKLVTGFMTLAMFVMGPITGRSYPPSPWLPLS
jgi:hypothetical protein